MADTARLPGFLAGTELPEGATQPGSPVPGTAGPVAVRSWGLDVTADREQTTLTVSRVVREARGAVGTERVGRLLRDDPAALTHLLPPFAAVGVSAEGLTAVADSLGFQHLFHSPSGRDGSAFVSSSSLVAGRLEAVPLDETAVAVQSLLGWQLGQRTLHEGVGKLLPGAVVHLDAAGVHLTPPATPDSDELDLADAVPQVADLLRTSLEALLDDHPDAVLQLTGGMDSRLLLSAIPERRRRGLRAMTLAVPGSGDVEIARAIAERYGIQHEVHGLADAGRTTPAEAWELCAADAVRLDAMADPVALAAQRIAERAFDQGVRISGLGGEVARGFYYVGRVRDRAYTRSDSDQLAGWRMFVNEAVEPGLLTEEFSRWARDIADTEVHVALRQGGDEWFRAADDLYVRHRMQRWAGATDCAVSDQRVVLNPMLDAGFLDAAARLAPRDKAGSRFLGRLQMELDPELGRRPLEGRPAPAAYAAPPWWHAATDRLALAKQVLRKANQKVRRGNRPPAGGAVMAAKVVEHWRQHPDLLATAVARVPVRAEWVDGLLSGSVQPRPSSVAFLTNLVVATGSPSA